MGHKWDRNGPIPDARDKRIAELEAQIADLHGATVVQVTPELSTKYQDALKEIERLREVADAARVLSESMDMGFASKLRPDIAHAVLIKKLAALGGCE